MLTKRKDLTIKEKKDLLVRFDKINKYSQRKTALALKIPQPTLNEILKIVRKLMNTKIKICLFLEYETK